MDKDRPSSTALFVANGVWWESQQSKIAPIIPQSMSELNRHMVECLNTGLYSPKNKIGNFLLRVRTRIMQRVSIPGFYLHFICRKRSIENLVRDAIKNGASQLVVVGAGFDTLSLRIAADFPTISVVEIDHPATQNLKRDAIPNRAWSNDNLHLLPLDLTQGTLADTLLGSVCYRADRPSVFVVEGLLMYLQGTEVQALLAFIKSYSGAFSRIIFTYMEEKSPGDYQFQNATWFVNVWLKMKKESFTWGLLNTNLADFLQKSGLTLLTFKTHRDFREEFLNTLSPKIDLARGENIGVASTGYTNEKSKGLPF